MGWLRKVFGVVAAMVFAALAWQWSYSVGIEGRYTYLMLHTTLAIILQYHVYVAPYIYRMKTLKSFTGEKESFLLEHLGALERVWLPSWHSLEPSMSTPLNNSSC